MSALRVRTLVITAAAMAFIGLNTLAFGQDRRSDKLESKDPKVEIRRALMRRIRPAIVGIQSSNTARGTFYGTGTMIHPSGYIMTSTTVVPLTARGIVVRTASGKSFRAKRVLTVVAHELSVIKIDVSRHAFLPLARANFPKLGSASFTAGNAFRVTEIEGQVALCGGIVSGIYSLESGEGTLSRNDDEESQYRGLVIETTAAINPGMDGGPLVNGRAEVIGLLSLAYSKKRTLGTAIPITEIVSDLKGGLASGGRLGMNGHNQADGSLLITQVIAGGAAAKAGLKRGDVVISVNGQKLQDMKRWLVKADELEAGTALKVEVKRGLWSKSVTLVCGSLSKGLGIVWPAVERLAEPRLLAARARVYRDAVKKVEASVATITVSRRQRLRSGSSLVEGSCSGVVVSKDGFLLTSYANVENAAMIRVQLKDGREFGAELRGFSRRMDLALLKVNGKNLPAAKFASKDSAPGAFCGVVGRGLGTTTLTTGIVSAVGRHSGACYQVDASMNLGNTGGAVIDIHGQVIGVGCYVGTKAQWRWGLSSGVGFAVTSRKIFEVLEDLKKGKEVDGTPVLGVTTADGSLNISQVQPGSPAQRAGVRAGDKIVEVNGKSLKGWGDLVKAVRTKVRGDTLEIVVERNGQQLTLKARL